MPAKSSEGDERRDYARGAVPRADVGFERLCGSKVSGRVGIRARMLAETRRRVG